ncbi:MAG: hypothetical protein HZB26_04210 [Candidatus Hydrogenedentes bacterium]|nr:hypothetical protein [Candidatus Hydrogenedentota bacterium]
MKKGLILGITLIAFAFVGIVGCGQATSGPEVKAQDPKTDAHKSAAPKAEAPKPEAPKPAAAPAAPSAAPSTPAPATTPASIPPATPAPAGAAITAQSIVGTSWEAGPYKLTFNADGKLKVNDAIDGTWSIEGTKLKIEAAGQKIEADIEGDKLTYNGSPLVKKS